MRNLTLISLAFLFCCTTTSRPTSAAEPTHVNIGNQRELFTDDFLIDQLTGKAEQRLHQPVPQNVVLKHDAPWEGTGSGYHSLFKDGDLYRMYYKAWHLDVSEKGLNTGSHPLYCCYAESKDGIHWEKPNLGICNFNGSTDNNIILFPGQFPGVNADPGHPAIFKDENPECPPESQYKAIIRSSKPHGLFAFHSPDGIHWQPMHNKPVITNGAFDSQNLAFWDSTRKEYRAYWRIFTGGTTNGETWKPSGIRAIRTATSPDFIHWNQQQDLTYVDSPPEQLYTNQIKPYHRAPHLFIGFPTRYVERGWNPSMESLPEPEHRKLRSKASNRYGMAITDCLLMTSRDGVLFNRWNEAFVPPGIEREGTWHYGHQYFAWHVVETKSDMYQAPNELSFYGTESYWTGKGSRLRRYTLRLDGFVSVSAPRVGGELITKPFNFSGNHLSLNFATSAAGSLKVEIQNPDGNPIPGFTLEENDTLFGNNTDRTVSWKDSSNLKTLAGKPIRLRFVLEDADLYSLKFEN